MRDRVMHVYHKQCQVFEFAQVSCLTPRFVSKAFFWTSERFEARNVSILKRNSFNQIKVRKSGSSKNSIRSLSTQFRPSLRRTGTFCSGSVEVSSSLARTFGGLGGGIISTSALL